MLRCTIELVPHGDETKVRPIGIVEIANDATGDTQTGNYVVMLKKSPPFRGVLKKKWSRDMPLPKSDKEVIAGHVEGFSRLRSGPYELLYLALCACGFAIRNPKGDTDGQA